MKLRERIGIGAKQPGTERENVIDVVIAAAGDHLRLGNAIGRDRAGGEPVLQQRLLEMRRLRLLAILGESKP